MSIGWPEGILLFLMTLGLGIAIAEHGKPREPWNAGVNIVSFILSLALLYWGGFFA